MTYLQLLEGYNVKGSKVSKLLRRFGRKRACDVSDLYELSEDISLNPDKYKI